MATPFDTLLLATINARFYYECGDAYQSATLMDSGGHANTGAINGSTPRTFYQQPGPFPNALSVQLDGTDNFIKSSASPVAIASIGAWVNLASTANPGVIVSAEYESGGNLSYCMIVGAGGAVTFFQQINAVNVGPTSTRTLNAGQWYWVVGTYDANGYNIYINGVLDTTVASATSIPLDNHPIYTGSLQGAASTYFFPGFISRPFVAGGTALTAAQIKALYATAVSQIQPTGLPQILGD